jgi:hypothetical protein
LENETGGDSNCDEAHGGGFHDDGNGDGDAVERAGFGVLGSLNPKPWQVEAFPWMDDVGGLGGRCGSVDGSCA